MLFLNLSPVAQMIEHLTSNQKVLGSNLQAGPDIFSGLVSIHTDCVMENCHMIKACVISKL